MGEGRPGLQERIRGGCRSVLDGSGAAVPLCDFSAKPVIHSPDHDCTRASAIIPQTIVTATSADMTATATAPPAQPPGAHHHPPAHALCPADLLTPYTDRFCRIPMAFSRICSLTSAFISSRSSGPQVSANLLL